MSATPCSHPGCGNKTNDPGGTCHWHRSVGIKGGPGYEERVARIDNMRSNMIQSYGDRVVKSSKFDLGPDHFMVDEGETKDGNHRYSIESVYPTSGTPSWEIRSPEGAYHLANLHWSAFDETDPERIDQNLDPQIAYLDEHHPEWRSNINTLNDGLQESMDNDDFFDDKESAQRCVDALNRKLGTSLEYHSDDPDDMDWEPFARKGGGAKGGM